jgi:hypothetical protein
MNPATIPHNSRIAPAPRRKPVLSEAELAERAEINALARESYRIDRLLSGRSYRPRKSRASQIGETK